MRMTQICANIANDDANKNLNTNNTNASEFTNNTNKNKIQNAKINPVPEHSTVRGCPEPHCGSGQNAKLQCEIKN